MVENQAPRDLAQSGRQQIEEAILRLLDANPQGLRNVDIARALGLSFDFAGNYKNHVTYGVLGSLLARGEITRDDDTKFFFSKNGDTSGTELAKAGLDKIEAAILKLLAENPQGLRNVDIAVKLGLESEFRGGSRNYLTYTVLFGLMSRGEVGRNPDSKLFTLAQTQ